MRRWRRLVPRFPVETVNFVTTIVIRLGRDFRVSPVRVQRGAKCVRALSPEGDQVAIGEEKLPKFVSPDADVVMVFP